MEFTAQQICDFLQGEIIGNANIKVNNISKIEEGKPGTLTFLSNPKYTQFIYTTQASIILVNKDFIPENPIEATLIKVENAYSALALLLNMVEQATPKRKGIEANSYIAEGVSIPKQAYIGAFAYLSQGVSLGENVMIYPHVYIGDNVEIGNNTILHSGVKIYHNCKIGNNCIIHAGAVIGSDGFGFAPTDNGYQKIAQIGNVVVEDDVEIGANATIDRATMGSTTIHKGVKLDNLVQIAHNVEIGEHTVMAAQVGIAGSSKVGKNCMFGGQVGIAGHISVGDQVTIGAQSGIPNSIDSNQTVMGYPAVNSREFARQVVLIKKLPELNQIIKNQQIELDELKKTIKK